MDLRFHLLHNVCIVGEHPDAEDELVLELKRDATVKDVQYSEDTR